MTRNEPNFMEGNSLEQRQAAYDWLFKSGLPRSTTELLIRIYAMLLPPVFDWQPGMVRDEAEAIKRDGFVYALKALGIAGAVERIAKYDYFGGRREHEEIDDVINRWCNNWTWEEEPCASGS